MPDRNPARHDTQLRDTRSFRDRALADERKRLRALGLRLDGSPRLPPGPAPKPADEQLKRVVVLLSPELHAEVAAAVAASGSSWSEWLRAAAIEKLARG